MGLDHGIILRYNDGETSAKIYAITWRKVNHIHKFFVDNVQDGDDNQEDHVVGVETLRHLIRLLKEVVENPGNAPLALPTEPGFFFGSTEYDNDYFVECNEAINDLEALLHLFGDRNDNYSFIYWSWW